MHSVVVVRRAATSAREIRGCASFRSRERLNEKLKSTASERINSISRLTTWYSTNARFSAEFSSRPGFLLYPFFALLFAVWTAEQLPKLCVDAVSRIRVHPEAIRCTTLLNASGIASRPSTRFTLRDICISSELSLSTFDHNNYLRIFHQK